MNWNELRNLIKEELLSEKKVRAEGCQTDGDCPEGMRCVNGNCEITTRTGKTSSSTSSNKPAPTKTCYRIDAGDCIKCPARECNKKTTPCKYKTPACKGAQSTNEATSVTAGNTKFNLRTGVNKNPTKLGVKIQFEPIGDSLESETKAKLEVAL